MNSQRPSSNKANKRITRTEYQRKKSQKIIIAMFCSIIVIIALCYAIMGMISQYGKNEEEDKIGTLIFYEADPDRNIFNDQLYLDLDRNIRFENPATGITVSITKEDLGEVPSEQRAYVAVVCDFINNAINGNHDELNSMFSDQYVEAGGELKLKFTMQQLYDIKITYIDSSSFEEDGKNVTHCDYWLEYKIRQNNGTFRHDMESDCVRKEYIRISNREEDFRIDVLSPYKSVESTRNPIEQSSIIILISVTLIILLTITIVAVIFVNVSKKKKLDNNKSTGGN